jgi:hypothetical protein
VCEERRSNIVFLSGDAHLSIAARFIVARLGDGGTIEQPIVSHSIHSSALYAPYPFANAVPEDFARARRILLHLFVRNRGQRYYCAVETYFPALGDGYALLTTRLASNNTWTIDLTFVSANNRTNPPLVLCPDP